MDAVEMLQPRGERGQKMKRYMTGMVLSLLLAVTGSCDYKEFCYDHPHNRDVEIVFDWMNAPDASPEAMRLYLFPESGSRGAEMYEFSGRDGGHISVPAGRYRAICINTDTETILYRNTDSFDTFEAYTPNGTLPGGDASQDRVALSPDRLYSGRLEEMTIDLTEDNQVVTLYPELSVCRYRFSITNVANLSRYAASGSVTGAISGMAGGFMLGAGKATMEQVTIPFSMSSDGESTLVADFLTFGGVISFVTDDEGNEVETTMPHNLQTYLITTGGSISTFSIDVSEVINNNAGGIGGDEEDEEDVVIDAGDIPVPEPEPDDDDDGNGGFRPTVDGWDNVDVDIDI